MNRMNHFAGIEIMSLRIATNVQSLAAQRYLTTNHENQNAITRALVFGKPD